MFRNREDAARRLAARLKGRPLVAPLVLAIPRGGVVTGAALARELGAELDVVLSRKLRTPGHPELAMGAVSEAGHLYLAPHAGLPVDVLGEAFEFERAFQLAELERRRGLYRAARPPARAAGRSVIVTDDGIATGSTMLAALRTARAQRPRELIVAVPVAPPDRIGEVREHCNEVVCLEAPEGDWAV